MKTVLIALGSILIALGSFEIGRMYERVYLAREAASIGHHAIDKGKEAYDRWRNK